MVEIEPLPCTLILKDLLLAVGGQRAEELIRQLEAGLAGGAQWCHDRIQFLGQNDPYAWDVAGDCHQAGIYRITVDKMREIARQGLVRVWQEGIISAIEIGAFADDIASLQRFSGVLAEIESKGQLAPVWAHAFDLPPGFPKIHIDLEAIFRQVEEER